jgi:isocitrate/isopropylmalate dehydrogenase
MFEPVHGSAPDIAGRGVANPMAAMLSGAQMLDFLGEPAAATLVEQAVVGVLTDRKDLTPDLGGSGTTRAVTNLVVARLAAAAATA